MGRNRELFEKIRNDTENNETDEEECYTNYYINCDNRVYI
jgi:hypothetical protein